MVRTFEHARRQAESCRMRANSIVVNGVCFAGLTTIVQPAAIAGAILRVAIASGKFQGVMRMHGPIGWRRVSTRPVPSAWSA